MQQHRLISQAPQAASPAGYHVIVPYKRGYCATHFLSGDTARNGQQFVLAVDASALMDALHIERAIVAGFDWGGRAACVIAALWPERCQALVSVSGYLIAGQAAQQAPLPSHAELAFWYQFDFATERGRAGYARYRREFIQLIWRTASPKWVFDDATFARSAAGVCPGHRRRGQVRSDLSMSTPGGWCEPSYRTGQHCIASEECL